MSLVKVTMDVYCQRKSDENPGYRVFVNNDLLTERTWIWPAYEVYIKENLIVDLDSKNNKIELKSIGIDPSNIIFRNVTVNDVVQLETAHGNFQEYLFTV